MNSCRLLRAPSLVLYALLLGSTGQCAEPAVTPPDDGQLGSPIEWFAAGTDPSGKTVKYAGQRESNGWLRLTASNGFFAGGIRAVGKSGDPFTETPLIAQNFEHLDRWASPAHVMRWHLFFEKEGDAVVTVRLQPARSGATVKVKLGANEQVFTTVKDRTAYAMTLPVRSIGKTVLAVAPAAAGRRIGKLFGVDVTGDAVAGAKILRARWRPGAVHAKFTSSTVNDTQLWVMSSKSLTHGTSYSPITTPFGYYGTSFGTDRRAKPTMNFSMWSTLDVPTEQLSHLLAVGSPQAAFSGFGHEGTGVKLRGNWQPLAHRPEVLTQALRVTYDGDYATYYGYFLDQSGNWRFFCSGRKWSPNKRQRKPLWPGAFVEVPGPPQSQRSGDIERIVHRIGWVLDGKGQWHQLDQMSTGKHSNVNKGWGLSDDGWFIMRMGGMEHFDYPQKGQVTAPRAETLPAFLQQDKVAQLYRTPARFDGITIVRDGTGASLEFQMLEAGPNARAVIYYGSKDCLTFAPRKLHGTERKSNVLKQSGVWEKSIELKSVVDGANQVTLPDVGTAVWLRILVVNDNGRQWSQESYSF